MNNYSTASSLPPNGKSAQCPETGCHESFDDASLVLLHFITSHPFSYIRLKKRGADALCQVVPGAVESCVVRRMRDGACGGNAKDVWKKMSKNGDDYACDGGDHEIAADDDDDEDDGISIVDEEIDSEIVKAYETLTMDGRRRLSLDVEDVSQCSEKEKAPTCLSPSPMINRCCPQLVSSTPLNAVEESGNHRSPWPSDEIAAPVNPTTNGSAKNADEENDQNVENENEKNEKDISALTTSKDDRSPEEERTKSSHKRRRSDSEKRDRRSRSRMSSRTRSLSPQREARRQRSRSASAPPKRRRRSASRCSTASKAGSRRSLSSSPATRVRRRSRSRSSTSSTTNNNSNNVKRRRRRSPSSSSSRSGRRSLSSRRSASSASSSRRKRARRPSMRSSYCSGEDLQIPCLVCAKTFPSPDDAYSHDIDTHITFGRFPCVICKKFVASDSTKLQLHIEKQHPARRRILKLPCPFCRQNFDLWRDYHSHLEWDYSARRRRVYEEIWRRSSLQCSLCGAETGAVDRRDFENHARDCRALKDNGGGCGRKEQPQPCCTRRHAERRGCIHFRTFCKKYPGCSGTVCDFAHPTCKFDTKCRTNNCEWFHSAAPRERCSMCGKNASSSSHDQSF